MATARYTSRSIHAHSEEDDDSNKQPFVQRKQPAQKRTLFVIVGVFMVILWINRQRTQIEISVKYANNPIAAPQSRWQNNAEDKHVNQSKWKVIHQEETINQRVSPKTLSAHFETLAKELSAKDTETRCVERVREKLLKLSSNFASKGSLAPIFIGGVGDSGTRSLVNFLSAFEVGFGSITTSRDSKAFMKIFAEETCQVTQEPFKLEVEAPWVYETILPHVPNFTFTRDTVKDEWVWWQGYEFVLSVMLKQLTYIGETTKLWGIKQPRITLFLPYFKAILGENFRYIHVVRDFRDTALGRRKAFFRQLCPFFLEGEEKDRICQGGLVNRLEFNARWNMEAVNWLQTNLEPEQFIVVRIEDLVSGKQAPLRSVLQFLQKSYPRLTYDTKTLQQQVQIFWDHRNSYSGVKYSEDDRRLLNIAASHRNKTIDALEFFGYHVPTTNMNQTWPTNVFRGLHEP
uniref:Sulfotransferase domain-containing protein n=1 Tax=Mucochytrium quahogii TaxID=96639 RepID=A0A7S2RGG2_9STRA|mmetsp:Transcript_24496/g.39830  ORF Transcript_24496/g.39830 Transcript_24496/m.39830 type:complete len:459 (-) Transcript_24496:1271-2647(-)